jgi:hypothetical protein
VREDEATGGSGSQKTFSDAKDLEVQVGSGVVPGMIWLVVADYSPELLEQCGL